MGVLQRRENLALAGWHSWWKHHPIHQNVAGLIPGQVTYLGCGFDSPVWGTYGRELIVSLIHWCFSLSPPTPLLPSLSKINKHIIGWGLRKQEIYKHRHTRKTMYVNIKTVIYMPWAKVWVRSFSYIPQRHWSCQQLDLISSLQDFELPSFCYLIYSVCGTLLYHL